MITQSKNEFVFISIPVCFFSTFFFLLKSIHIQMLYNIKHSQDFSGGRGE